MGSCSADTTWTITGLPAGDYWFSVQALDNGFLPGSFATPVPFTAPVGVAEYSSPTLTVYPNPCREQVRIGMWDAGCGMKDAGCGMRDAGCGMKDVKIRVYNQNGKLVFEGRSTGIINTSSWSKGLYLLLLTTPEQTSSARFIKE
jgi:hypothetical protein